MRSRRTNRKRVLQLQNRKFMFSIIRSDLKPVFLNDHQRRRIVKRARQHGINPETHCYYPQLARYHGDPEAFVQTKQELYRKIKERGLTIIDEA